MKKQLLTFILMALSVANLSAALSWKHNMDPTEGLSNSSAHPGTSQTQLVRTGWSKLQEEHRRLRKEQAKTKKVQADKDRKHRAAVKKAQEETTLAQNQSYKDRQLRRDAEFKLKQQQSTQAGTLSSLRHRSQMADQALGAAKALLPNTYTPSPKLMDPKVVAKLGKAQAKAMGTAAEAKLVTAQQQLHSVKVERENLRSKIKTENLANRLVDSSDKLKQEALLAQRNASPTTRAALESHACRVHGTCPSAAHQALDQADKALMVHGAKLSKEIQVHRSNATAAFRKAGSDVLSAFNKRESHREEVEREVKRLKKANDGKLSSTELLNLAQAKVGQRKAEKAAKQAKQAMDSANKKKKALNKAKLKSLKKVKKVSLKPQSKTKRARKKVVKVTPLQRVSKGKRLRKQTKAVKMTPVIRTTKGKRLRKKTRAVKVAPVKATRVTRTTPAKPLVPAQPSVRKKRRGFMTEIDK